MLKYLEDGMHYLCIKLNDIYDYDWEVPECPKCGEKICDEADIGTAIFEAGITELDCECGHKWKVETQITIQYDFVEVKR